MKRRAAASIPRHLGLGAASAALLALGLASCSDDSSPTDPEEQLPAAETRAIERPVASSVLASPPAVQMCGTPLDLKLTSGAQSPGRVMVGNDAERIYVTYTITEPAERGWMISDTRLAIAKSVQSIPKSGNNPDPWSFPYAGEHEPPVTTYTYSIALSQVGVSAGATVYVAAMAGVVHPKTSDWGGAWEWMVMWGTTQDAGRKRFETIHTYRVASCGSQPPPPPPPPPPPTATGGVITLTFDDGWLTTYTKAYPVLRSFGLKGNIAINPQPIDGGWTSYMTLAQVRELHGAGWAVVSHSVTHRNLTTLSDAALTAELVDSKAWIDRNGFRGSSVFVVPYHAWGTRERNAIQRYYKAARGYAVNQFWPDKYVTLAQPYDLTGYEPEYAPWTTPEGRELTMDYVEKAVQEGYFLDLFFHQISDAQLEGFRELMRMVAAYAPNVRTYAELVP